MLAGFVGLGESIILFRCFRESVLTARTTMVFIGHIYLVVYCLPTGVPLPSSNRKRLVASHDSLDKDAYEIHNVDTEKDWV